jgi:hypothetical protein
MTEPIRVPTPKEIVRAIYIQSAMFHVPGPFKGFELRYAFEPGSGNKYW